MISDKHTRILKAIIQYRLVHGISPSYRQITEVARISSTSVVEYNVAALRSMGYLNAGQGRARASDARSLVPTNLTWRVCPNGEIMLHIPIWWEAGAELAPGTIVELERLAKEARRPQPEQRECVACGAIFLTRNRHKKTCDDTCSREKNRAWSREYRRRRAADRARGAASNNGQDSRAAARAV